jgi:hypothetical protein
MPIQVTLLNFCAFQYSISNNTKMAVVQNLKLERQKRYLIWDPEMFYGKKSEKEKHETFVKSSMYLFVYCRFSSHGHMNDKVERNHVSNNYTTKYVIEVETVLFSTNKIQLLLCYLVYT